MRRLAASLVLIAAVVVVPVVTADPASACDCAWGPDASPLSAQSYAEVDAVFVGRAVDRKVQPGRLPWDQTVVLTFAVDNVYKGEVTERQEIVSLENEGTCGLSVRPSRTRHLVLGIDHGGAPLPTPTEGQYASGLCWVGELDQAELATLDRWSDAREPQSQWTTWFDRLWVQWTFGFALAVVVAAVTRSLVGGRPST